MGKPPRENLVAAPAGIAFAAMNLKCAFGFLIRLGAGWPPVLARIHDGLEASAAPVTMGLGSLCRHFEKEDQQADSIPSRQDIWPPIDTG
jgi:hypothetical protein